MSHLGPETKAIIEAINGLKKPAHEDLTYLVINIDLAVARANVLYELPGWFDFLAVGTLNGSASIRINEATKDLIDLAYVKTMKLPIRRLYITNDAQPGSDLTLALGGDASFDADPVRSNETIFHAYFLDEDGGSGTLEDSYAKTDTPVHFFPQIYRYPLFFKKGIALRVHYRLNPTNAVTYTLRIYRYAYAANYESNLSLIYESAAARVDDTDYDVEIEKPFILPVTGVMYYAIEWSAAPGVTLGFVEISGIVKL